MSGKVPSDCGASLWDPGYRNRICAITSENLRDIEELHESLPRFLYVGTRGNYDYAIVKMEGHRKLRSDADYQNFIPPPKLVDRTACVIDCMSLHRKELHRPLPTTSSASANIFAIGSPSASPYPEPAIWPKTCRIMDCLFDLGKLYAKHIHDDPDEISKSWFETDFGVVSVTGPPSKVGLWLLADPLKTEMKRDPEVNGLHGGLCLRDWPNNVIDTGPVIFPFMRISRFGQLIPGSCDKFAYARIKDSGPENLFAYEFADQSLFILSPDVSLPE